MSREDRRSLVNQLDAPGVYFVAARFDSRWYATKGANGRPILYGVGVPDVMTDGQGHVSWTGRQQAVA
jgi:hypothetical protein